MPKKISKKSKLNHKKQRGIIGIALIGVFLFIFLLSAIIFSSTLLELTFSRRSHERLRALEAAEGGIDVAQYKIKEGLTVNYNSAASPPVTFTLPSPTCYTDSGVGAGTYSNSDFNVCWEELTPSPITSGGVQTKRVRIVSEGYVPTASSPQATRRVESEILIDTNLQTIALNEAIFTDYGGFRMQSNSTVSGNVFSNGPISIDSANVTLTSDSIQVANSALTVNLDAAAAYAQVGDQPLDSHLEGLNGCNITRVPINIATASANCPRVAKVGSVIKAQTIEDFFMVDVIAGAGSERMYCSSAANAARQGTTYESCDTPWPPAAGEVAARTNPFTTSFINAIKTQAENGGVCGVGALSSYCPTDVDLDGNKDFDTTLTNPLHPCHNNADCEIPAMKIPGYMKIDSNDLVVAKGTLWIAGAVGFDVESNSGLVLDCETHPGGLDDYVVVDGHANISSNAIMGGTILDPPDVPPTGCVGSATSYYVMINTHGTQQWCPPGIYAGCAGSDSDFAIIAHSNSSTMILASTRGWISLRSNANLNVSVAWGLHMDSNAQVVFPLIAPNLVSPGAATVSLTTIYYKICKPFLGLAADTVCPDATGGP